MSTSAKSIRPLFRDAAIRGQSQAIFGHPQVPPSRLLHALAWGFVALLATGAVIVGQLALTRHARAAGVLQLSNSGITVTARVAGTLTELQAREGAQVEPGDLLGRIAVDHRVEQTQSSLSELANIAERQRNQWKKKRALLHDLAIAQRTTLELERAAIHRRLRTQRLDAKIRRSAVEDAERQFDRIQRLFDRGFVRVNELDDARNQLVERRHALINAKSLIAEQQGLLDGLGAREREETLQSDWQILDSDIALADVQRRLLTERLSTEQVLVATLEGTVAGLTLQSGDTVTIGQTILSVLPPSSRYQAVLMVDDKTIRRLQVDAPVMLTVSAYPHEHYGRLQGRIREVADLPSTELAAARWRVLVDVTPATGFQLTAGMQVDARLMLERRRVFEWLAASLTRHLRGSL